jgi:hypothetical protein
MNATVGIVLLDFFNSLFKREVKQVYKLLEAVVLYFILYLKNKLAHNVFNGGFIDLIERLILFFLAIKPVVLHLFDLFLFCYSDLIPDVAAGINKHIRKIFKEKIPQKLDVVDFLQVTVKRHVL